jgi:AcrR family transcriptional regulator
MAESASLNEQPSSSRRRQLMEKEVLEHATRLFAERGFSGTSLQDVAESMGLKRPALYYYFSSKDALLERLIAEATLGPAKDLRQIGARDEDPEVRLHAMASWIVKWIIAHSDLFKLMLKSESDLSPSTAKKFNDGRRAATDAVRSVIEEGVASGHFRNVDPQVAAFSVWGVCNWVAFWYQPDRSSHSVDGVAAQVADMAVAGVQPADRRESLIASPQHALKVIRDSLDSLERGLSAGD